MYASKNKENPGKEQRPREERLALPHMRGYYKAPIIKSLILAQRQADRQTRKESPEIDPTACENLVYHQRGPGSSDGKESTATQEAQVRSLGWGRSLGGGNSNQLQYS